MATMDALLTRVQKRLSMIAGPGAQRFAEDNILEFIQTAYERWLDKDWWDEVMVWATVALDGTTGLPTTDLTVATRPLVKFTDIKSVQTGVCDVPIPKMPSSLNPDTLSGSSPTYYLLDPSRVFKISPYTSTGNVSVNYRTRLTSFTLDTQIPADEQLMVLMAAYEYMADDGTNPTAVNKLAAMVQARENELMSNLSNSVIPLNEYERGYAEIYEWHTS